MDQKLHMVKHITSWLLFIHKEKFDKSHKESKNNMKVQPQKKVDIFFFVFHVDE